MRRAILRVRSARSSAGKTLLIVPSLLRDARRLHDRALLLDRADAKNRGMLVELDEAFLRAEVVVRAW
jgi:hypothetical protein